jgi:L-ascorbate metabolism protein UlaG (beta-lactamase superfamily)
MRYTLGMHIFFFVKVFLIIVVGLWLLIMLYERLFIVGKVYQGDNVKNFKDGEFLTPEFTDIDKSFRDVLKWNFSNDVRVPWDEPYTTDTITLTPFDASASKIRATFINHATVLVETKDYALLTDPIFTKRASPFSFMGPARHHDPYVPLTDIPRLDYVLISHAHYDHLSAASIARIEEKFKPIYITPLNNSQFIEEAGVPKERIIELETQERYSDSAKDFSVTLETAKHWSARGFSDRKRYLWGSFVIESAERRIFFAGDTGYDTHFSQIKDRQGKIDLALLPIGAYEPRWFMKEHHMNPEEAVQAAKDLGEPAVIGIHFGTFRLTNEGRYEPEQHTKEALNKSPYGNTFLVPTIQNGLQVEVK